MKGSKDQGVPYGSIYQTTVTCKEQCMHRLRLLRKATSSYLAQLDAMRREGSAEVWSFFEQSAITAPRWGLHSYSSCMHKYAVSGKNA